MAHFAACIGADLERFISRPVELIAMAILSLAWCSGAQELLARRLTPLEADSYSYDDGAMSAFWSHWVDHDSSLSTTTKLSGSDTVLDAELTVKVAATSAGLYVWWRVRDDSVAFEYDEWACQCLKDWSAIAVDSLPPAIIKTCVSCNLGYFGTGYTCGSRTVDVCTDLLPSTASPITYGHCIDIAYSWWANCYGEAAGLLNVRDVAAEFIRKPDSTLVAEVYIPWRVMAMPAGTPLAGREISFCVTYMDYDNSDLGWKPVALTSGGGPIFGKEYWGGLRLPADLEAVDTTTTVSRLRASCAPERRSADARVQNFSLSGQVLRDIRSSTGIRLEVHGSGMATNPALRMPR